MCGAAPRLHAMNFNVICSALPLTVLLVTSGIGVANAQPGMTPPGSVPPYSAPPPASPGPAGPPDQPGAQPGGYGPEPYYGPPMPPQVQSQDREGFNIGLSAGLGTMESDAGEFACSGCEPVAVNFEIHAGKMLSPVFALHAELWFQSQSLEANGTASINQTMYLLAAQYWVHPRVWLRAGIGGSNLSLSYETGFGQESESLDTGLGMQGGIGFELIHSQGFSLDALIKTGAGMYSDRAETISATTVNIGVNWY